MDNTNNSEKKNWREKLHIIIYEADTPAGKWFDIILLCAILISIGIVMLESVKSIDNEYHDVLNTIEWIITILFTIEYIARIISVDRPLKYIFSFYGIVDLLSTIPKYISIFYGGTKFLVVVRALRLLRVFRVLKMVTFMGEASNLSRALKASRHKIMVFIASVLVASIILGTIMYLVEGEENGFTSIPRSIYWTIVTLTTVGYGDIAPQTTWGQFIATIVMVLGYGVIAVPTGIVSSEIAKTKVHPNTQVCSYCLEENHPENAKFCFKCGEKLD